MTNNAEEHFNKGIRLSQEQQFADAFQAFSMAIKLDPSRYKTTALDKMEIIEKELGYRPSHHDFSVKKPLKTVQSQKAEDAFEQGIALFKKGKYEEAIGELNTAIELDHDRYKLPASHKIDEMLKSLSASALANSPHQTSSPKPNPWVKFLTANVGNSAVFKMGQYSFPWKKQYDLHSKDVPILRAGIGTIDPQVVFLQEVAQKHLKELFRNRPFHYHHHENKCIAVSKNIFQYLGFITAGPGYMSCIVETKSGEKFTLVNIHTKSPLNDFNFTERANQISGIIDYLLKRHEQGVKLLAAGDFNCDPYHFKDWGRPAITKTQELWKKTFSSPFPGSLKAVKPIENTWSHTWILDHIITNLGYSNCTVLDGDDRIDHDKYHLSKNLQVSFMDHRAVTLKVKIE